MGKTVSVITETISISTHGNSEMIDITRQAAEKLAACELDAGVVTLFISGSTAGLTTVEYEPGLIQDLPEAFEKIAPKGVRYHHDDTWGDGNGHSHVRASLLGPSLTVPFRNKKMMLGTWQQIIVIDFDNRSRQRDVVMQIMGE